MSTVEFRAAGTSPWRSALPLVRVDYNGSNMVAGSVLFLAPGVTYDVKLTLADPDGGAAVQTVAVTTRPVPAMPAAGRTFHVVPGSGGGNGSAAAPFRGVAAAEVVAQPGDTLLVHAGSYGGRITFTKSGTSTGYVVWRSAGDGEALFAGIDVSASYIWLEGLTVRDQPYALMSKNAPTGVVISRCSFFGNHYSIYLQRGGSYWYIADNTIVGDTPYATESLDGEGIELNGYRSKASATSWHTTASRTSRMASRTAPTTSTSSATTSSTPPTTALKAIRADRTSVCGGTASTTPLTTASVISLRTTRRGTSSGISLSVSWKPPSSSGRPTDRSSLTTPSSCGAGCSAAAMRTCCGRSSGTTCGCRCPAGKSGISGRR